MSKKIRDLAFQIQNDIKKEMEEKYSDENIKKPSLFCLYFDNDKSGEKYVNELEEVCKDYGIVPITFKTPRNTKKEYLKELIENCNKSEYISAILIQFPIEDKFEREYEGEILNLINMNKNVESLIFNNLYGIYKEHNWVIPNNSSKDFRKLMIVCTLKNTLTLHEKNLNKENGKNNEK